MKAEGPIVPEFDRNGQDAEARPMDGARYIPQGEACGIFGHGPFQGKAALEGARLRGRPGTDTALARTSGEILIGFLVGYGFDGAAKADLAAERLPVETGSGLGSGEKLNALGT